MLPDFSTNHPPPICKHTFHPGQHYRYIIRCCVYELLRSVFFWNLSLCLSFLSSPWVKLQYFWSTVRFICFSLLSVLGVPLFSFLFYFIFYIYGVLTCFLKSKLFKDNPSFCVLYLLSYNQWFFKIFFYLFFY